MFDLWERDSSTSKSNRFFRRLGADAALCRFRYAIPEVLSLRKQDRSLLFVRISTLSRGLIGPATSGARRRLRFSAAALPASDSHLLPLARDSPG